VISVLLPFREAVATIDEAIASVLADLGEGDELLAIDDRSTDGSSTVVRKHAASDRRVVLVTSEGAGIVAALTTGLAASRGDLVARMDADDISLPGRFHASRALLESDASLGVVATRIETIGGEGLASYVAWQNSTVTPDEHAAAIFVESPVCHPTVTMRRSALVACDGYHESPWAEDWDLWLRMIDRGFGIAKVPQVLLRWRRHPGALTVTDPRYSPERMREARARYLARRLGDRPFAIWGAGKTGRRLARALETHHTRPRLFVDIDARKKNARGLEVVPPDALAPDLFVVVAVGAPGARDVVRARLASLGRCEGVGFICAA
jgi:glycosyltransferase involved in cell wall biosynthesis